MGELDKDIYVRCVKFSEMAVGILRGMRPDYIDRVMVIQLVRSATSVGANMMEASESVSKKDFINRLAIALKEAKESRYWIGLLLSRHGELQPLAIESDEITRILATIKRKYINVVSV
ncbi:MAG: four helix bundle protein [Patescibacteria group bacterium]|jgi:four helix bundle protein